MWRCFFSGIGSFLKTFASYLFILWIKSFSLYLFKCVTISWDNLIEIFDTKSGDLLGSRELGDKQNFLFRGFDWIVNGDLAASDEFQVLTNTKKKDDGSNLERLIALSSFSDSSGKGGYSERYNDIVTSAGFELRSSEQSLINAKTAHDVAKDQKSEFFARWYFNIEKDKFTFPLFGYESNREIKSYETYDFFVNKIDYYNLKIQLLKVKVSRFFPTQKKAYFSIFYYSSWYNNIYNNIQ